MSEQERYNSADIEIWKSEVDAQPTILNYANTDYRWVVENLTEGIYEAKFKPDAAELATAVTPGYGITVCTFSVPPMINKNDTEADVVKEFNLSIREGKDEILINLEDNTGATIPATDIEWVKLGGIFQDTETTNSGEYSLENVPYGNHLLVVKTDNDDLQPYYRQVFQVTSDSSSFTATVPPPMDLRFTVVVEDATFPDDDDREVLRLDAREHPNVKFYQKASAPDSNGNPFWLNLPTHTAEGSDYRVQDAGDGDIAVYILHPTSDDGSSRLIPNIRYSQTDAGYKEIEVRISYRLDEFNPELILR